MHGGHVDCREALFQQGFDPNEFSLIIPSRPGYGNTPLTPENKSPKGTADLIVAPLDKLEAGKVIVIGVSAGGLTAIELASNYPQRVDTLVLMSALTKKWFSISDRVYKGGKVVFAPGVESFTLNMRSCSGLYFSRTDGDICCGSATITTL